MAANGPFGRAGSVNQRLSAQHQGSLATTLHLLVQYRQPAFDRGLVVTGKADDETLQAFHSVVVMGKRPYPEPLRLQGPVDDEADMALPVWAGVRPVITRIGDLIPD